MTQLPALPSPFEMEEGGAQLLEIGFPVLLVLFVRFCLVFGKSVLRSQASIVVKAFDVGFCVQFR